MPTNAELQAQLDDANKVVARLTQERDAEKARADAHVAWMGRATELVYINDPERSDPPDFDWEANWESVKQSFRDKSKADGKIETADQVRKAREAALKSAEQKIAADRWGELTTDEKEALKSSRR